MKINTFHDVSNPICLDKIITIIRHTDKHLGLIMTLLFSLLHSANGSGLRAFTDGQSDGRILPSALSPCFAKLCGR